MERDEIDDQQLQWAQVRPDIDTSPAAIFGRVLVVSRMVQLQSDEVLRLHGVTRADFDILSLLVRSDRALSPTTLSQELHTSGPGTTKRIRKLETAGLIERTTNPADARGYSVAPTAEAVRLIGPILEAISRLEKRLLERLSDEDQAVLTQHLRKLLASVAVG